MSPTAMAAPAPLTAASVLASRPTTRIAVLCASSSTATLEVTLPLAPRRTYMAVPSWMTLRWLPWCASPLFQESACARIHCSAVENNQMKVPAVSMGRLAAFTAVAEAGSFTAAAERLNTTKSAVSQAVTLLERELGAQLLQRSTRKLAITEAGEAFLADCRALLTSAEAAMERARTGRAQPSGTLRLTSTQGTAGMVASWIATFRERYPAMRIDYVPTDR